MVILAVNGETVGAVPDEVRMCPPTVRSPVETRLVNLPVPGVVVPMLVPLMPVAVTFKLSAVINTLLAPPKALIEMSPAAVVVKPKAPALVKSGEVTEVVACRVVNLPVPAVVTPIVVKLPAAAVVKPIAVLLIPVAVVLKLPAVTSTLLPANGVIEISPAAVVVKPRAPALVNSGEVTEVVADRVVKAPVP